MGDSEAPGDVTNFTAIPGNGQVELSWTNPTDDDFVGTMIRYRTDGTYPTNYQDGAAVENDNDGKFPNTPGSDDGYTHTGLDNDITYYYSAFTYDNAPNYSETAHAQATPDGTQPTVTITQPTSEDTHHTPEDSITLGGSASDNINVTSVTWANNQGGNGTASGTTPWTISAMPIHCGDDNIITITAKDAAGNTATDTLTIDVKPCPVSGMH